MSKLVYCTCYKTLSGLYVGHTSLCQTYHPRNIPLCYAISNYCYIIFFVLIYLSFLALFFDCFKLSVLLNLYIVYDYWYISCCCIFFGNNALELWKGLMLNMYNYY